MVLKAMFVELRGCRRDLGVLVHLASTQVGFYTLRSASRAW